VDRPDQLLLALEPEVAALACHAAMCLKQESCFLPKNWTPVHDFVTF
jgi:hypothetical protein